MENKKGDGRIFGVKLSFYRWKEYLRYWLINKLRKKQLSQQSIDDIIYEDIIHTFAYNESGYYCLYMRKSPISYIDLETIIQDRRGDYTPVNEIDLNACYEFILDNLMFKFVLNPSVVVCPRNENGVKYFEVYWKNYKQTIK